MPLYVVERILPGATLGALEAMRCAAREACRVFTAQGTPVRYLRSTFTPGESRCRCLFEAATGALVQELNDAAQLPYSHIAIAVEMPGEPSPDSDR